eukprot:NODE_6988_length_470_cov_1.154217.p3 GENE.NODE_6988_length_470_cov_1.154217~~NODE_6988_length_470_cov_1.154217.p3  ORF type:complete len:56 (+),score=18.99 NODE_6988_length_470_cov_1.154217:231-398(+)
MAADHGEVITRLKHGQDETVDVAKKINENMYRIESNVVELRTQLDATFSRQSSRK